MDSGRQESEKASVLSLKRVAGNSIRLNQRDLPQKVNANPAVCLTDGHLIRLSVRKPVCDSDVRSNSLIYDQMERMPLRRR